MNAEPLYGERGIDAPTVDAKLAREALERHGRVPMPPPNHAAVRRQCPVCGEAAVLILRVESTATQPGDLEHLLVVGRLVDVKHLRISADFTCAGVA